MPRAGLSDLITFTRTAVPADDPVTLAEARTQCRLVASGSPETHADDDYLARLIDAATAQLDGEDGLLGRCLITQTWQMRLNTWPGNRAYRGPYLDTVNVRSGELRVPLPPVQSVDSITYRDVDGVSQTLDLDDYHVETVGDYGRVIPRDGAAWPNLSATWLAPITVTWTAGYGAASTDVPEPIRHAMLLRIGRWYDRRHEDVNPNTRPWDKDWPAQLLSLLTPYRIWSWRS